MKSNFWQQIQLTANSLTNNDMKEKALFEELENINDNQPVSAGDLIGKNEAHELLKRKWSLIYEGKYCITELGKKILAAKDIMDSSIIYGDLNTTEGARAYLESEGFDVDELVKDGMKRIREIVKLSKEK